MMKLQQLVKERRGHWPERKIGPSVPEGSERGPPVQGAPRAEARHLAGGPVRQRQDETEIRIRPGDAPQVLRTLHDEPDLRFEYLADLSGVETGTTFKVVYHLWSDVTPDGSG